MWGEYAVLDNAPAAVMAVDRYADVTLQEHSQRWLFSSTGLRCPGVYKSQPNFSHSPCAQIAETILATWGFEDLKKPFTLASDSAAFFQDSAKLGLGSSAAICTATYVGLAQLFERPVDIQEAITMHRNFQSGKGSGLDVAASFHGGVIRYQQGQSKPLTWPPDWHFQLLWSGASASTTASLGDFEQWRETDNGGVLEQLGTLSSQLCEDPSLTTLKSYIETLKALDEAAQLNIFTPAHHRLATIAHETGVIYKPCGAGGGDVGLACSDNPEALARFSGQAETENFAPLDLEIAEHGVRAS